jgi:hypothetical protein
MKKSERNEDNFKPIYVKYKKKIYATGNRYHTLIELYKNHKFIKTVLMKDVEPLELDISWLADEYYHTQYYN